jgi:glycosyltransferase involved in cell wall biosynthesis
MRFHVLAIPHTITREDYSACAFTQKVLKFCRMMTRRGHTVYHYGHADSRVDCTEHVPITDNTLLRATYGDYDWHTEFFKTNTGDLCHKVFNERAIEEVGKRKQSGDFLLAFWGQGHLPTINAHPDLISVEPGIGCFNKPCARHNVFESYAVMSAICGKHGLEPSWYDAVIPNYFDFEDFDLGDGSGGYFLYVGRIIPNKGVGIAMDIAKACKKRLVIAGQGDLKTIRDPVPDHVEFVGYADPEMRRRLMMGATAVLAPSHYLEPFGGVAVEAMLCGTPIITSDWGGFAEFNIHGTTGWRCRTMDQFVWAAQQAATLDRYAIRLYAVQNFSLERVARMYEEYFGQIQNVYGKRGFYEINPDRGDLEWLVRYLPK